MARKPSMLLINYLYVTIRKPNVRDIWHFKSQNVLHQKMLLLSIANSEKKKKKKLMFYYVSLSIHHRKINDGDWRNIILLCRYIILISRIEK